MEPLVTGQVEPLGPLMKGLLETPGLTVTGQLGHGQVNEAPVAGWGGRDESRVLWDIDKGTGMQEW